MGLDPVFNCAGGVRRLPEAEDRANAERVVRESGLQTQ
jgi:hypothetical protein